MLDRRSFLKGSLAASVLVLGSAILPGCTGAKMPREVTDMVGRTVNVRSEVRRAFCTNPIGTTDLYCLAPDAMVGWNFKPSGLAQQYIPEQYMELPSLGVWMGAGNTPSPEEIARQDPHVLLCFWTADDVGVSMADEITKEASIPVLVLDYDLRNVAETLRFMGELLGCSSRAEELATYCTEKLAFIQQVVDGIPDSERKSIYLAQSTGGLSTDPVGSMHVTDALELLGTRNVADLPGTVGQGMGMPTVNIEQVVQWNPDAVLVSEYTMSDYRISDLYGEITADKRWQNVKAVKRGDIYAIPQAPFSWFGRPPSVVRLLGCMWLLKLLYPDHVKKLDIRKEAREFYELFYRHELTQVQEDDLLRNSGID